MGVYLQDDDNQINRSNNVTVQNKIVSREMRGKIFGKFDGFRGCTLWLTGLSGAGKTSIAFNLENYLIKNGIPAYCLDGDNMRSGINKNLNFSKEDRKENIRRSAEVAKLFADSGHITICSFVSPFSDDRFLARKLHQEVGLKFFEIFINASLDVCESRDVKGLYKKARDGTINSFTGIGQDYQVPNNPDLVLDTEKQTLEQSTTTLIKFLEDKKILPTLRKQN
ncbi:bifunctional 3'-phosphoadenosine 5'-phosphosulfate synthase 2-like [Microplitis mediator]|uniref:bifunctional 3'-phosphoadenosine 5'-phosphosulfate synthase 2-like n=1 Tax=Microplitis mediator TaxID=375433 RepID=UPI002553C3C6|nr:bifunctional 3'-phosphoadenosine 5'-phosphosulfate synthase 2-like [Microplitis mediator]